MHPGFLYSTTEFNAETLAECTAIRIDSSPDHSIIFQTKIIDQDQYEPDILQLMRSSSLSPSEHSLAKNSLVIWLEVRLRGDTRSFHLLLPFSTISQEPLDYNFTVSSLSLHEEALTTDSLDQGWGKKRRLAHVFLIATSHRF